MNKDTNISQNNLPSHSIEVETEGTPEQFWQYFEPIDLSKIFKKTRFFPAVSGSTHVERWDTPGQERTVSFESGDTAKEEILKCSKPNYFQYKVSRFSFVLKYLCSHAIGEWNILEYKEQTKIKWTYTFYPHRLPFTKLMLKIFVRLIWKDYMELSMRNIIKDYKNLRNKKQ